MTNFWQLLLVFILGGIIAGTFVKGKQTPKAEDEAPVFEFVGISPESFSDVDPVSNYDADTIMVNIHDVPPVFGYHIPVRLSHVDAPEINSPDECAREVASWGKKVVADELESAKQIDLIKVKRDKYFRVVAEVMLDGKPLHEMLLKTNLAAPYEGGDKPKVDWCKKLKEPLNKE